MNNSLRAVATLAAAVLGVGTLAAGGAASAQDGNDPVAKREESVSAVLTADDDGDDDDTDVGGRDTGNTRTGAGTGSNHSNDRSGVSRDGTNSRHTKVSRDRDKSRGDLTKDWTRDGGDRTRDHSRNKTNDRSRNDTR